MAHEFSGSAVIDRLINDVFEFLADGTNDPKFSPRVQQIRQTTDGPIGVGTVFESTVKDAGMTSSSPVRADRVRGADEDSLDRTIQERGHRSRWRL